MQRSGTRTRNNPDVMDSNNHLTLPAIRSPSQVPDQSEARNRGREVKEVQPITPKGPPVASPRTRTLPRIVAAVSTKQNQGGSSPGPSEPPQGSAGAPGRQGVKALSLVELSSELTLRMDRLNSLDDFSTKAAAEDMTYIRTATRHWTSKESRADLAVTLSSLHLPELFQRVWTRHFHTDFLSDPQRPLHACLLDVLVALGELAGASEHLSEHAARAGVCGDALGYLGDERLGPDRVGQQRVRQLVQGLLVLLYAAARAVPEAREEMRAAGAVATLQRYRGVTEDELLSCRALVVVAYIVPEEEDGEINADDRTFQFLLRVLDKSLASPDHVSKRHGLSSLEIVQALNRLAACDDNKGQIVRLGALPCYVRMLAPSDCSVEEQGAAAQGLWTLAFKCKEELLNEPSCVEALQNLADTSTDKEVRQHARGALWILSDGHLKLLGRRYGKQGGKQRPLTPGTDTAGEIKPGHMRELQSPAPLAAEDPVAPPESAGPVVAPAAPVGSPGGQHVFISYQWGSKPVVLKLRDRLKAEGYRVWVDVDNMAGSVLEAMAEAVENAIVVLICMTQKYKESPNCRTEAEYTFRLQKEVVPIRLQTGYTPDGWLGALSGSKLVHDFSEGQGDQQAFSDLCRDLGGRGRGPADAPESAEKSGSTQTPPAGRGDVANWAIDEVTTWLNTNHLLELQDWFHDVTGPMLLEYKAMRQDAPEAFHAMLAANGFHLADMLRLNLALKQL